MKDYRICQLDPTDIAFENGARWALMAPQWVGDEIETRSLKLKTLTAAIDAANKGARLVSGPVTLAAHRSHGDPMTLDKAVSWVDYVRQRAVDGNKAAIADLDLI
jgi:hypothetical protein